MDGGCVSVVKCLSAMPQGLAFKYISFIKDKDHAQSIGLFLLVIIGMHAKSKLECILIKGKNKRETLLSLF